MPGVDAPFDQTAERYAETGDASLIWRPKPPAHWLLPPWKLHNLEALPSTGFTVSCFPTKFVRPAG